MSSCSLQKKKERPMWQKFFIVLFNKWFWDLVYKRIVYNLFPWMDKSIKLFATPLDATLVSLDGTKKLSLLNDFVNKMPKDMPLIINMGSYN
jgi:hypothetical protein